jgi:CHAD domain-containing protein
MKSKVEPLRGATPAKRGMKELTAALASRRNAAFARAKRAVASPRYRSLLLDTLQWLEDGEWVRRSRRSTQRPIERFAADILERRTKKAVKKAKKLRELDARQRHKLRIAVKKLRYSGDFFGRLFSGQKRLSAYQDSLKELQDRLGALNDIRVHQKMVPELASGKPRTNRRERVFAAGVVSGREESEIEPLLNSATKDASKFAQIRPFWT